MALPMNTAATATADLAAARRRSDLYGLDPETAVIPHLGDTSATGHRLRELSSPLLDQLLVQIADTSLGVVLADRDGRVIRRDAPISQTVAEMDRRSVDIGFSLAESGAGTNGVGTSLETQRPTLVVGAQHFLPRFDVFTCANAPIFDPITHRVEGTVGLVGPASETTPLLLSTALQLAKQISDVLLQQASPQERLLLEQFLLRRRTARAALATVGDGVVIATPSAQRLLNGVDHAELWERVEHATRHGGQSKVQFDFDRPSGPPLRLRCEPVIQGGELRGAMVEVLPRAPLLDHRRPRSRTTIGLGDLVGQSDRWNALVAEALTVARLDEPVLVAGEPGTGRLSIASEIAQYRTPADLVTFDSTTVLLDGPRQWIQAASDAVARGATVVVRRVDQLPDDVAASFATAVARVPPGGRVLATTGQVTASGPGLAALLAQLDVLRLEVPPLRERRSDIEPLARRLLARHGRRHVAPGVLAVLYRQPWPGNVTQLSQTLRAAHARAGSAPLRVAHLPLHLRQRHRRRPLHGLRQQEADAIVAALDAAATKADAARLLGISRATLYRRIASYALDVDPD